MAMKHCLSAAISTFFEYDTPRIVHIRSKKVGTINRFLQLVIIGYIIGYVIVYKKGYQDFDNVQGAVTTKVKGIVFTNDSVNKMRTWDVADYVIPPQEADAFFVMTNVHETHLQTQATCPESLAVEGARCNNDTDCEEKMGTILPKGNGPINGSCVYSDFPGQEHEKVCAIFGWCPVENTQTSNSSAFLATKNFTVFIKNNIEFPMFNVTRRNLPENGSLHLPDGKSIDIEKFLNNCTYIANDHIYKHCPMFRLETIVNGAGVRYEDIAIEGGVMQIIIDWTCNLDLSENKCLPSYSFRRLDKGDYSVSKNFNFRYANQYAIKEGNDIIMYRDLYKATGIRFLITIQGQAGQFRIVPLLLNVGSGMALLGIATILCDIVVLYFLKARTFYKEKKYLDVKAQDAFQWVSLNSSDDPSQILEEEAEHDRIENNGTKHRNVKNKIDLQEAQEVDA